ncbi:alpha-glucoside transport system substrate-binding protein [Streptomyces sp. BK022]|uniref:ABC transporter substrate-binding protein n=1 Tax=Streptomyces sp. BK022 TaxID=2512123 RepID=UPI00102A46E1|nr:ABC transporter substrate-binding protein [Streptomyces sp. BK022]RZU45500.1 alpha-glucoside transport system substrate-binding protein [Streptomyces sp. BK022]
MRRPTAPLLRCALILGLLLASVSCGGPEHSKVTIMVPWSGTEFQAFYAVVKDFERGHPGIDVEPQITRALTQQLDAAVGAGAEPDLAVLPSVGAITKYRTAGALRKLDVDTGAYAEPFRALGMHGRDVYAVPVKADLKSLIWYDARSTEPPSPGRPGRYRWCLGLESGPTSGWPGADWIADLLLSDAGVDTYTDWASGNAAWAEGPVRDAWTAWGHMVGAALKGATARNFRQAAGGKDARGCALSHGSLSAMPFDSARVSDDQYTYVPSSRDALEVSADFVGKFTRNEGADAFITYLASTEAQRTWVNEPGFAVSADRRVTEYDNAVQGRIAGILRSPDFALCFSAADAMDPDVSAAFYRAVLDYANGKEPGPLLAALDKVQQQLGYPSPGSAPAPLCSTPKPR